MEEEYRRIAREVDEFGLTDPFDEYDENRERGLEGQIRLSDDAELAFRQISVGFRKWILRYISDCSGQRINFLHGNRLFKVALNAVHNRHSVMIQQLDHLENSDLPSINVNEFIKDNVRDRDDVVWPDMPLRK
jgi:hypothetical protein